MIEVKRIFPECNSDTLLVELIFQRGKPAHYKGNSKVAEALKKHNNDNLVVVGVVDSDKFKNTPPYLKEFTEMVFDYSSNFGLILKKKPDSNKYIVFVCPAFEKWIWDRAIEIGINPAEFGFRSINDLLVISKRNEIREIPDFKRFVNEVVSSGSQAVETLKQWLLKVND